MRNRHSAHPDQTARPNLNRRSLARVVDEALLHLLLVDGDAGAAAGASGGAAGAASGAAGASSDAGAAAAGAADAGGKQEAGAGAEPPASLVGGAKPAAGDEDDAAKAAAAAAAAAAARPSVEDQRKFLTDAGAKAEELAKLDEAALAAKYDEAKAAADAAAKASDTYKDLKAPDGLTLDPEGLKQFTELAGKHKLTAEAAQELLNMHAQVMAAGIRQPYDLWKETQAGWQKEVMADAELGGAKWSTVTEPAIARAIEVFATDPAEQKALRQAFSFTGAGNNPHIVRFMARVGAALAEGEPTTGGKPAAGGSNSAAAKLYQSASNAAKAA